MVTSTGVLFRKWESMGITADEIQYLMLLYRNEEWPLSIVRFTLRCL